MSLDKRSIELGDGQWAVKEDKLFAFRRDRDKFFERSFDFSRASEGTIINSDGYIQYSGFGDELVTNGDFEDGENGWTLDSTSPPIVENGLLKFNFTSGTSRARQSNSSIVGLCKITYTVVNSNISQFSIREYTGAAYQPIPATEGTHTVYKNFSTNGVAFQSGNTVGGILEIDDISVQKVNLDTPRISYDIVDGVVSDEPHLLLEPERINYIFQSQKLSELQIISSQYSVTDNQAISPTGEQNASLLQSNSTGGQYIGRSFTLANDRAISAFVKYNNSATRFYLGSFTTTNDVANAVFDIQNGIVLSETTGSTNNKVLESAKIEDYGNGWFRCSAHISGTTGVSAFGISDTDTVNYIPDMQVTGLNLFAFGFQVEQGSYATSYIPTYGTTVTRVAEIANNSGNVGDFNNDDGVLYAEIGSLKGDSTSNREISLSDGTTGNSLRIYFPINYENRVTARLELGGSFAWVGSVDVTSKLSKVALRYDSSGLDFFVNGVKELTTTTLPNFTNSLSSLQFRRGDGNAGADFYGKCKALKVYTEALNDAELRLLTKYAPKNYDVAFTADYVDTVAEINILRTEATDKLYYVISDGANEVSGSATITATEVTISNIDISSLNDGTLTVSVYIEDERKQRGVTVTDTTIKDNTNTPLYSYALQQRATGAVIEELDNAEAIIESLNVEV